VLYLLVSHSQKGTFKKGLSDCALAGWSTPADFSILQSHDCLDKACHIRHALPLATSVGHPGFREKFGIPARRRLFLSCGGYWPHKRMKELAAIFEQAKVDALLVTTGYHTRPWLMPRRSDKVLPLFIEDRRDVLSAMAEADCYIMHSAHEGFGLVLLEAMLNRTPWIAHEVGGAIPLKAYGTTYQSDDELRSLIETFSRDDEQVARGERFVRSQHLVEHAVDDIERAASRCASSGGMRALASRPNR
jgi:hypothetical protein